MGDLTEGSLASEKLGLAKSFFGQSSKQAENSKEEPEDSNSRDRMQREEQRELNLFVET